MNTEPNALLATVQVTDLVADTDIVFHQQSLSIDERYWESHFYRIIDTLQIKLRENIDNLAENAPEKYDETQLLAMIDDLFADVYFKTTKEQGVKGITKRSELYTLSIIVEPCYSLNGNNRYGLDKDSIIDILSNRTPICLRSDGETKIIRLSSQTVVDVKERKVGY